MTGKHLGRPVAHLCATKAETDLAMDQGSFFPNGCFDAIYGRASSRKGLLEIMTQHSDIVMLRSRCGLVDKMADDHGQTDQHKRNHW